MVNETVERRQPVKLVLPEYAGLSRDRIGSFTLHRHFTQIGYQANRVGLRGLGFGVNSNMRDKVQEGYRQIALSADEIEARARLLVVGFDVFSLRASEHLTILEYFYDNLDELGATHTLGVDFKEMKSRDCIIGNVPGVKMYALYPGGFDGQL